jgi:thymidylate synthase
MYFVSNKTIGETWLKSIKIVMEKGNSHFDEDVEIKEILGLTVEVSEPKLSDNIIDIFGDENVVSSTLRKFSRNPNMPDKPFTYGELIYNKEGVDQFQWLVDRLKKKKETKSATISLLIAGDINPNLPCLVIVDAKIRNSKLNLQFFFRSQNILGRQYANLLALAKIQYDLAEQLSVEIGTLKGYVASAHIYDYDFKIAKEILSGNNVSIKDLYYQKGPKSIRKTDDCQL